MTIHPAILCGGSGTRLWPLSRAATPKQFLSVASSDSSLLQDTVSRLQAEGMGAPILISNADHRFLVAEQMLESGITPGAIVLEPMARSTAPAAAVAALLALETDPEALVLLLPSDHVIAQDQAFLQAVGEASVAARQGKLVTFGITPTAPETGYGYIQQGLALADAPGVFAVDRFVEKPDVATAEAMLAEGGYAWNSGMFLFQASTYLAELDTLAPDMAAACRDAVARAVRDQDFVRLDEDAFAASPSDSIDYAVMEKTARAAVVPADLGWNDVGAWSALWDIGDKDEAGNVVVGDVHMADVQGSYLRSDGPLLAAVGVDGLAVVATDDAVLVLPRERAGDVKLIVEKLKHLGRGELLAHPDKTSGN